MTPRPADRTSPLPGAVDALTRESSGVLSPRTVTEVLLDSLDRLRPAQVRAHQPVPAHRSARQRRCTQDAGRAHVAAALPEHPAEGRVVVRSAGSTPADGLHEEVVDAAARRGGAGRAGGRRSARTARPA